VSGGLDIKVNLVDAAGVAQWLRALYKDQIPFATKVALDATAFDARRTLVDELRQHFTVRTDWTARRMRVQKATKQDLVSYVGSTAPYMELQALGGVKRPRSKLMGAPTKELRALSPDGTARRKLWPNKWIKTARTRKRRQAFTIPLRSGRVAVMRWVNGEREQLYTLTNRATIKPGAWPLYSTVRRVAGRRWAPNAVKGLKRAIKTSRRKR
jgi:hypothetical protein